MCVFPSPHYVSKRKVKMSQCFVSGTVLMPSRPHVVQTNTLFAPCLFFCFLTLFEHFTHAYKYILIRSIPILSIPPLSPPPPLSLPASCIIFTNLLSLPSAAIRHLVLGLATGTWAAYLRQTDSFLPLQKPSDVSPQLPISAGIWG